MASQGVLLSFIQKFGGVVLSLILVRILSKEDFGAFTIASSAVMFLMTVSVQNFAQHSFHISGDKDPGYDLHLGFALILHGAISLMGLAAAGILASTDKYAPVAPLLLFGATAPILNAPRIIYTVALSRDLAWRRIRTLGIASFVFAACGTISLAILGCGGLALMCQIVLAPVPFLVDMVVRRRDLLRVSFRFSRYREAFNFGGMRSVGAAMVQSRSFVESTAITGVLGLGTLGVFGRAFGLAQLTTGWLSLQLASITYPVLAKFEAGTPSHQRASGMLFRFSVWTAVPPAVAVALSDHTAIAVIYGERWLDATPYFRPMIGVVLAMTVMAALDVVALSSVGARFVLVNQTAMLLIGVVGLAIALPISLVAYSWFIAISFLLLTILVVVRLIRARALTPHDVLRTLYPAVTVSSLAVILGVSPAWPIITSASHLIELVFVSVTSAALMLVLIRVFDRSGLVEALRFAPDRLARIANHAMMLNQLGTKPDAAAAA
jgi:O-antigen/teichoic acid export membrane protein